MKKKKISLILSCLAIVITLFFTCTQMVYGYEKGFSSLDGGTDFALNLYSKLSATEEQNLCFSPFSIFSALSMVYEGAVGNTRTEMGEVLGLPASDDVRLEGFSGLFEKLESHRDQIEVKIANSLWAQENYPIKEDYKSVLEDFYSSGIYEQDFMAHSQSAADEINRWVEDNTKGRIKDLFQKNSLDSMTRLVLVNAVYFLGDWQKPFDESRTREEEFFDGHKKIEDIPFMTKTDRWNYYSDHRLQAIELPYAGYEYSLIVMLPSCDDGLGDLENLLSRSFLYRLLLSMEYNRVELHFPRFELKMKFNLSSVLKEMGIREVFNASRSDLSGITEKEGLYISEVVHGSFLKVNEKGTEAAAATGIGIRATSLPPEPVVMKADHPFIYMLYHRKTSTILFMGRVVDPSEE